MNQTDTFTPESWRLIKKFAFRFFFIFCVVSIVPFFSDLLWPQLIKWSGNYFFHESVTYHPSGSGDTLYDFYGVTIKLIFSLLVSVIWSIIDRKRNSYNTLLYWQEVYIRYYLAFFLVIYGLMKVIKLQFVQPSLSALLIPLGHKSPMGLAWTFMGYSDSYTIFSGFCETLAACLLIYRKTRTLGALIGFGVMLNVFLMNMSYDIPVKLFSFQLAALLLFLMSLDHKRLIGLFILNSTVEPQKSRHPFKKRWANVTTQIVKGVAIIAGLGFTLTNNIQNKAVYGDTSAKPPMYGIYDIEEFIINNDTLAPTLRDTIRWRYLVVEKQSANIFHMRTNTYDDVAFYNAKTDSIKKEIVFLNYSDSTQAGKLHYVKTGKDHYVFKGIFNKDTLILHTTRTDEKDFPLMNTKFHWINEYPYNR